VAMKNATDSASDLVDDLQLTYNSIRQASITQELAEISAATNAFERN
jgi:F-type H+-transporting ATPase subunit gamma